jgi:transcription termination factor Rho
MSNDNVRSGPANSAGSSGSPENRSSQGSGGGSGYRESGNREGGNRESGSREGGERFQSRQQPPNRNQGGGQRPAGPYRDQRDSGGGRGDGRDYRDQRPQGQGGGGQGGGGGGRQQGGGGGFGQNRGNQQGRQQGGGGHYQQRHDRGGHGGGGNGQGGGGGGGQGPVGGPPAIQAEPVIHDGFLEISEKGFGFLRSAKAHFAPKPSDVFLTPDSIKRLALREGCHIKCTVNPPHRGNSPQLREVLEVNERPYQDYLHALRFENLTTIDPIEKFQLETTPESLETRIIDLVTPIGKGTRGLIVAPPRTGKTTVLKQICNAITTNHPDVHCLVLLIDERPEEVTDFQRSVKAEVVASSNDQDLETHVRLSRFMIERAKRMVEAGKDVFVLLDSLTRVARAYNSVHGGSGRTMTGGVDARALEIPRKMFAAARKVEEGGSLTILATALIDTGSRMDELIFQEFKGTGNMELILDRKLSERRLYPAIDIPKSGTRKEEKLFEGRHLEAIRKLRRMMTDLQPVEAMETLLNALKKYKTNEDLLAKLA